MAAKFHPLKIIAVRKQADLAVSITLGIPESLIDLFRFTAGQYLTVRNNIDGEEVRRSYSICSGVEDSARMEIGIKQVEGGKFSTFAQTLSVCDTLQVMPPDGRFTVDTGGCHRYLLIASGSGITPCLSIAKSVLKAESDSHICLLYGNRNTASMMFRADLNDLKDQYAARLQIITMFSAERQGAEILNGRIDAATIAALSEKNVIHPSMYDGVFVCGPYQMMDQVTETMANLGTPKERIHRELFSTDGAPIEENSASKEKYSSASIANATDVQIVFDGTAHQLQMNPSQETVLVAAQRSGLDLPFSCAGGMCCTCRCKIVDGKVNMDVNYSLADWEIESGYTLACQARPTSSSVALDFDAS